MSAAALPAAAPRPVSGRGLASYALLGLPLAMTALPINILLPDFYARETGLALTIIGLVLLATRVVDAVADPLLGTWVDAQKGRGGYLRPILVAAPVLARAGVGKSRAEFAEAALFTHKGLSGPAILQVSSYWKRGEEIGITFLPAAASDWLIAAKRDRPRAHLRALLREHLPDRLADALADKLGLDRELGNLSDSALRAAQARLADWRFAPSGTEGFAKAEVTSGGISTAELSSQTMEAKRVPGLYAIGEAVDVTGWLGGYNFQWAWASGHACGSALAHQD